LILKEFLSGLLIYFGILNLGVVFALNSVKSVNKNRCSLDIAQTILSITSVRVRKTRIMYGANLSFRQVQKYLCVLLRNGLLEHDVDSGYLITGAGKKFLRLYEDYLERSKGLRQEVERNTKDRLKLESMCFNNTGEVNHVGIEKDSLE
jgi:predicted transcriptional regulator